MSGFKSLSNGDIDNYYRKNKSYYGTRPSDMLPHKLGKKSIVINFDTSDGGGTHWVCMWNKNPKFLFYFDSFGLAPPKRIKKAIMREGKKAIMNTIQIQNIDSNMCGYYCCYVIDRLDKGDSFTDILYDFEHNTLENEKKIKDISDKMFGGEVKI